MKIERTQNASRNIVFGVIMKLYQMVMPFIIRTVMIYFMGAQYLGLDSLFVSILQVLNLAELGVGSAMTYSMYKPIAEDDKTRICALMRLYKIYYRVIGLVIAIVGIAVTPFITCLIRSDLPDDLNVYFLYWLNLAATVLSYWLFAYKNSLLQAHQRTDVVSKVTITAKTLQYGCQVMVLIIFRNFYLYVITALVTQAIINVMTAVVSTKMYPQYKAEGKLEKVEVMEINHRIRDLFTSKIGTVILNSSDTIVISAFLGLTELAVYQNYYFVLSSILGLITIIYTSVTAGIGNSLITESKEKNYRDLNKFTFLICWIAGVGSACFLGMFQPFMRIWMNDNENLMLPFSAVVCFVIYFFLYEINQLLNTYKDAAGLWHADRFRPLVTSVVNFVLNLIMVQFWGIYGVILSTVIAMVFVGMPWLLYNLFTTLFEKSLFKEYFKKLLKYIFGSTFSCVISTLMCKCVSLGNILTLLIHMIICILVPCTFFYFFYRKSQEYKECVELIDKMTKGKLIFKKVKERE